MSDYNQNQDRIGGSHEEQRAALEAWLRAAAGGGGVSSIAFGSSSIQSQQQQQQQHLPNNYEDALAQARALLVSSSQHQQPQQQPQHLQQTPQPQVQHLATAPTAQLQQPQYQQYSLQQPQQTSLQPSQFLAQTFGSLLDSQQQQQQQQSGTNSDASNLLASLLLTANSGGLNPGLIANSILGSQQQQQQQQQQQSHSYLAPMPAPPQQMSQHPSQSKPQEPAPSPSGLPPQPQTHPPPQQPQGQQHQQFNSLLQGLAGAVPSSNPNGQSFPLTEAAQRLAQLLASEPNAVSLLQGALQVVSSMTPQQSTQDHASSNHTITPTYQGQSSNSSQQSFNLNQQQQQQQPQQFFNNQLFPQLQNSLMAQQPQQHQQLSDNTNQQGSFPASSQLGSPSPAMAASDPTVGLINLASAAASRSKPGPSSEISGSTSNSDNQAVQYEHATEDLLANVPALPAELLEMQKKKPRGRAAAFPKKLFQMLTELEEQDGGSDIASFLLPHGRAFRIHKPKEFTRDILPKYFQMSSFSSFQRQLNLYSFQRITDGPERDAYYHELFVRGQPLLCTRIKRDKAKGSIATRAAQEERLMQYEEKCKEASGGRGQGRG